MAIPNSAKIKLSWFKRLLAALALLFLLLPCPQAFCRGMAEFKGFDGSSFMDTTQKWTPAVSFSDISDYFGSLFRDGFPSSLYLLDEYIYNGGDTEKIALPIEPGASSNDLISTRELVGTSFGYGVSRFLRIEGTALFNPYKSRVFLSPLVKYSVKRDLDIAAGIQVFSALDDDTDFGSLPNLYFAELKILF